MMISMIVLSIHCACPRSCVELLAQRVSRVVVVGGAPAPLPCCGISACNCASFACQRGTMRWNIRAQVILSMQTSIDLPDSQRVEQCSTKSAASLSSRSSAVMTS